ncbi:MAG TPA: nuclear transport factor 2 family protein [Ktedonobacteraceae bacterium]|nr:nuclear transport factor 2 family protein [Ktedonobacteraceae bacterium]
MPYINPLALIQAWQDAANRQDSDRLVELSAPDIEVVGPRGSGHGYQLLKDWLGRAGLHLTTLRAFTHDNLVVVAQHAVWRSAETGEVTGERDLASRYRIDGQRVVQYARYDNLDVALVEAGLHYSDEIPISG